MTPHPTRRGGRLWPAVLAVSAALVLAAGGQLVSTPPTVAGEVPLETQVAAPDPAPAAPSPVASGPFMLSVSPQGAAP